MQQVEVVGRSSDDQMARDFACALVCDHKLAIPAGALASRLAKSWHVDVHLFIERPTGIREKIIEVNTRGVTYHYEELFVDGIQDLLPDHPRFSRAAWGRVFLPKALSRYKRILYCDIDILPGKRPQGVESFNLPHGLGMVRDSGIFRQFVWTLPLDRQLPTNLKGLTDYFNSGVILMDPSQWDEEKTHRSVAKFITNSGATSLLPDQDFLNLHFSGKITELSPNMNFQEPIMGLGLEKGVEIAVRHYSGNIKPFHVLPALAVSDALRLASKEYQRMAEDAGLPITNLFPYDRRKMQARQLKNILRCGLLNIGVKVPKIRRLEADWRARRRIVLNYIQAGFDQGRFADLNVFDLDRPEPAVKYDGMQVYPIE